MLLSFRVSMMPNLIILPLNSVIRFPQRDLRRSSCRRPHFQFSETMRMRSKYLVKGKGCRNFCWRVAGSFVHPRHAADTRKRLNPAVHHNTTGDQIGNRQRFAWQLCCYSWNTWKSILERDPSLLWMEPAGSFEQGCEHL